MDEMDFLRAFGKRLQQLRKSKELSYRKMSTMCDIDYSDISKIEKGQVNIQLSTILELSKALEVEPKEFFEFNKD
ncbi:hypothetical protein MTsPCn5_16920 [Croceitalea sp. MTPC5]|uniref:Helix-turn-helix domain-containing protein n=1 Tax=Croceitalea marina TaxID=1775166 RepID=A0ABW5MVH4_9FLAO|nr:hypothetical protein MTsPCn5_16920 [Croceitalea sp. MTPC5]